MTELGIGQLITTPQNRDAIHIAVVPVTTKTPLKPGDHVGVIEPGNPPVVGVDAGKLLGIVDPYLKEGPTEKQLFWLHIYPGTIQSLRHHWIHKDIPEETVPVKTAPDQTVEEPLPEGPMPTAEPTPEWLAALGWIDGFSEANETQYREVMEKANAALQQRKLGGGWGTTAATQIATANKKMQFVPGRLPAEFWEHYATVSGVEVPSEFIDEFLKAEPKSDYDAEYEEDKDEEEDES